MREMKFLKNLKKKHIIAGSVVIIILIVYLSIRGCGVSTDVEYQYERISMGEVVKTISVTGKLDVLNSYQVLSKINGVVNRIYVDYNQQIRKGQLLANIDSTEIDQQLLRVGAQLEKAKLDLVGARTEYDTKKDLFKDNLISKKDLDQAELNYKKIQAQLQQFRIDYDIAWKNKSYTRIVSPASGVVFAIEVKSSEVVGLAKPLFVIAEDLRKMYLTISVDESDIGRIAKGQRVTFTVSAFPSSVFEGKIDQIRFSPINTEGIVTYQAIVICDNKDQLLKPGMTATATIIVAQKNSVKRILNEAFIVSPMETKPEPGKKYIWKKVRMKMDQVPLKRVQVNTGVVGDYYTEILSDSIKTGDQILVRIDKKLKLKDNM